MIQKTKLACFLLAVTVSAAFLQEQRTEHTSRNGLPADDVRAVAATGAGAVYAGTSKGLVKFENGAWRLIRPEPTELLAARGAQVIAVAGGDLVFLGNDAVEGRVSLPADAPRALAACGDVWLGGNRLYRVQGSALQAEAGAPEQIQGLSCAPDGMVAVAARGGLFLGRKGGPWVAQYPWQGARSWAPKDVRAVAFDARRRLWFASPQGAGVLDGSSWRLFDGADGLPYDDFTALAVAGDHVWFGTKLGAIRYEGDQWRYRQGRRWLPHDEVRSIAAAADGVWIATAHGLSQIAFVSTTFSGKARFFEKEIDLRHRRTPYQYVLEVQTRAPGDKSSWVQHDSDNDGLWTAMYGAGACFACAATKDESMCAKAGQAFEALKFLGDVTQGGSHPAPPGFVARTILPASGPDPNAGAYTPSRDRERQKRDNLWKVIEPRWPRSADGQWYWKSDTSSDELDGHYFLYGLFYDLVARTEAEKRRVRDHVARLTDHLLDHGFRLVDHDGKVTRWGVFDPATLNGSKLWWEERGLNSLSMLTYLKVAEHITGNRKYAEAQRLLLESHHYGQNLMYPKANMGEGTGNQSDDEMAFMNYYHLLKYETDPELRQRYGMSLARYWELERNERNPLFHFIAAVSLQGIVFQDTGGPLDLTLPERDWLEDSLDTLRRFPLDRFNWGYRNSHRKDIERLRTRDEDTAGGGHLRNGKVVPYDEQFVNHWNHNPWALDYNGAGTVLADGAAYLLPYYMGLYHGIIRE